MRTRHWQWCVMSAFVALPVVSQAQERTGSFGASAVSMISTHERLGDPMNGWAGYLHVPVGRGRYSVRATAEQTNGTASSRRTGSLCGGSTDPASCGESLRDEARLTLIGIGLGQRVATRSRATLDVLAQLQHALVSGTTTGESTGGFMKAERRLWGLEVGLEATVSPWATVPLALDLGASLGAMRPFGENGISDAPAPFEDGFGVARLRVGLSFHTR